MKPEAGKLLKSTPLLKDSFFEDTLLFIAEHNETGHIGFVINKPFERRLNELEEFKNTPPFPLYNGGPVDREHLFILHRRPDIIEEGKPIGNGLYLGGRFRQVVEGIKNGLLSTSDVKVFIGYCGWNNNELEEEIREGSWEQSVETVSIFSIEKDELKV
jgi:putative transcriptional regulator